MANRVTLNVSLTPTLGDFVGSLVDSGRYLSASEVVREGLRLLEQREERRAQVREALEVKLKAGMDSLERGDSFPADEVFAELYEELASAAKQ